MENNYSKSLSEIDLNQLFQMVKRNKYIFIFFCSIGLIFGLISAFVTKKVYQGQFQIVLDESSSKLESRLSQISPALASLTGLTKNKELNTQVGILKSPSVLMDIFKFVDEKNNLDELRFDDWKESLNIELEKGTSILNLSYQDTNKDIILPVLDRISNAYQNYSGKKRSREIELGLNYFEEQVELYKKKSEDSMRNVQEFAFKHDLSMSNDGSNDENVIPISVDIEKIRIEASNKLRLIKEQIESIENLDPNSDQILFLASILPEFADLNFKKDFVDIDNKISRLKTYLKDNDIELVDARNKKKALIEFRREQILGFLKAEKQATEQRLKAAERPKGIVIKYMQLLNRYIKDQTTFNKLENEYRVLLLEQARSQDPLELITKPTLLPDHVAPSKRVHTAVGLLVGTLLGFGTVLVIDKRKNILYTIKDLEEITKWQTILEVPLKNSEVLDELLVLFTSGKLLEASRSLAFIKVGAIEQKFIDKLSKNLKKSLEDRDFLIIEDFEKANNFKDIILINELGSTTYQDIIDMKKKLLLVNSNILGSIVINNFN